MDRRDGRGAYSLPQIDRLTSSPNALPDAVSWIADRGTGAGGAYGAYTLKNYMGLGDTLERRMLQLAGGTMIVMDTFTPAADHDGDLAGPVWQLLPARDPLAIGSHAFDAGGFFNALQFAPGKERLLITMEDAPGRTCAAVRTPEPLWGRQRPCAVSARSSLVAGKPVSFVTVLLPHDEAANAQALASQIAITRRGPDSAKVVVPESISSAAFEVQFNADRSWSVGTQQRHP